MAHPFLQETLLPELPHLGFVRVLAHGLLQPWVQSYWMARATGLPGTGITENLYPDGGVSLTFDLVEPVSPLTDISLTQQKHSRTFRGSVDSVGIRFYPGGAFGLLNIPIGELDDTRYDAAEFVLPGLEQVQQQLRTVRDPLPRFAVLDSWLLGIARRREPSPGLIQHVVPELLQEDNRLQAIVQQTGVSRRTLERQFQLETGLSPGRLKTLLRVRKARYLIKAHPELSLTEIAYACGFYDQAHFSRQFADITGHKPGAYRRRERDRRDAASGLFPS